jgi:hypothetical protein
VVSEDRVAEVEVREVAGVVVREVKVVAGEDLEGLAATVD